MYKLLLNDMIHSDQLNIEALKSVFEFPEKYNSDQFAVLAGLLTKQLQNSEDLTRFIEFSLSTVNLEVNLKGIDVCGTGGSGIDRINTSTLVAFILSSLGYPILKHGNRAGGGRFGSFDLIEALGIEVEQNQFQLEQTMKECNISLIYAPSFFPFLKHFAPARKSMEVASVFNIIGPLLNPFKPNIQLIGTPFKHYANLMYRTAKNLGRQSVYIYGGEDRLDDVTLSSDTFLLDSSGMQTISPELFGLKKHSLKTISAKSNVEKISIAKNIISGTCTSEHYKFVAMNVAFILRQLDSEIEYKDAFNYVDDHIKSGKVEIHKERYISVLNDNKQKRSASA